jgi:hypothetical protein
MWLKSELVTKGDADNVVGLAGIMGCVLLAFEVSQSFVGGIL